MAQKPNKNVPKSISIPTPIYERWERDRKKENRTFSNHVLTLALRGEKGRKHG